MPIGISETKERRVGKTEGRGGERLGKEGLRRKGKGRSH